MNGFIAKIKVPEITNLMSPIGLSGEIEIYDNSPILQSRPLDTVLNFLNELEIESVEVDIVAYDSCPLTNNYLDSDMNIFLAFMLFSHRFFSVNDNDINYSITQEHINEKLGPYSRVKCTDKFEHCSVCINDYKPKQGYRILPCGHIFHKKCIDSWFKKKNELSCPYCRDVTH